MLSINLITQRLLLYILFNLFLYDFDQGFIATKIWESGSAQVPFAFIISLSKEKSFLELKK